MVDLRDKLGAPVYHYAVLAGGAVYSHTRTHTRRRFRSQLNKARLENLRENTRFSLVENGKTDEVKA